MQPYHFQYHRSAIYRSGIKKKPTYQVQLLAFPYLEAKFVVRSIKRSTLGRKIETVGF